MVRRLLAIGLVAVVIAVGITVVAGRDDPGGADQDDAIGRGSDELGCPLGEYANSDFRLDPDGGGDLVVCHLALEPLGSQPSYVLDWSRRFDADESAAVRRAIMKAPRGRLAFTGCDVAPEDGPGEFFLVFAGESVPYWVYNGACGQNGISLVGRGGGYQSRLDTAAVLDALGSELGPLGPDKVRRR